MFLFLLRLGLGPVPSHGLRAPQGGPFKAQSARQTEQVARARREQSQAELNELKLAERRGELIDAAKAERSWSEHITEARNALLGVATHLRTRFPQVQREVFAAVDARIREALESLSEERGSEKDSDAE